MVEEQFSQFSEYVTSIETREQAPPQERAGIGSFEGSTLNNVLSICDKPPHEKCSISTSTNV